jgi:hypothetical protein
MFCLKKTNQKKKNYMGKNKNSPILDEYQSIYPKIKNKLVKEQNSN